MICSLICLILATLSLLSTMAGSPLLSYSSPGPKPWLDNGSVFQSTAALYLPCVEGVGTSRNFWTAVRTGRYDWDNFFGAGLADQLLKTMRSDGNYSTLQYVIRDMIAGGTFDGVEIGFLREIAMDIAKRNIMAKG